MLYVTPGRYRTMGFGAALDEIEDSSLEAQLRLASSLINRYCARPHTYDFRGGIVIDEKHPWRIGNEHTPRGSVSVFPYCKPVLSVASFQIYVTNTQYLDVATQYLNIGSASEVTPVIAASSIGIWTYSAIPVAGLPVPELRITYSYGYSHSDIDDELFTEGGGVYRAPSQWLISVAEVTKNDTPLTLTTDYTVNMVEGTITLSESQQDAMDLDDVLRMSYTHSIPEAVRDATAVVVTDLIGAGQVVGAGLQGLSRIKAEEIELATDAKSSVTSGDINERAKLLLAPYREFSWG